MNFVGACFFTLLCSLSTGFIFTSAIHIPTEQISSNVKLIAVGGHTVHEKSTADVDILSLSSNSHTSGMPLPSARAKFGSVLTNNTVYVLGGFAKSKEFLAYDVAANKWAKLTDFPYEIYGNALVALNGSIISIGGFWHNPTNSSDYGYMNYTYKYDPQTLDWVRLPTSIPADLLEDACAVVDHQSSVFVADSVGNTYRSDDGANTWTILSKMREGRDSASCVAVGNGKILVTGGQYEEEFLNSTEIYDIAANTWKTAAPMSKSRALAKAVVLPGTNDVAVCGGFMYNGSSYQESADCELYNFEKDQWTVAGFSLKIPRSAYGLFAVEN